MYRTLLSIILIVFSLSLYSQSKEVHTDKVNTYKVTQLKVYPNPATHFIKLNEITGINALVVYNLVGRKIKEFKVEKGKSYSITELPKGMYLIQFVGVDGKVLTTQRLSKR